METQDQDGGSGEFILPGKGLKNARMERRAIMRKWSVPDDALAPMVERQIAIAKDGESHREATQAFLAVLSARSQDLKIEELESGVAGDATQVNVNVSTAVQVNAAQSLLNEPEYLEFLRLRALEADSVSGPVRESVNGGPVENGEAPEHHRPGTNGFAANGRG